MVTYNSDVGRLLPGIRPADRLWVRDNTHDNIGFGAAANELAKMGADPLVLFVNPDGDPQPGCFDALEAAFEDPGVVAAAAVDHFGAVAPESDPDWLWGACLAVRRSAFARVGGFDESLFLYAEDTDLSYRLAAIGRIVWAIDAVYAHDSGPRPARAEFYQMRNGLIVQHRHGKERSPSLGLLGALEAARHGRLAVSAARLAGVAAYAQHRLGPTQGLAVHSDHARIQGGGVHGMRSGSRQKLSIVIVTYNCADDVEQCLRSIASNPPLCDHEIVVIDNDSADATRDRVRGFPEVRLIERADNAGYGTAVNEAVATTDGSHLLFLNPDTIITPGCLGTMLAALASAPERVGVVGPRLMLPTGEPQLSARRFPAPGRLWAEVLRLHRLLPAHKSTDGRRTEYFPADVSGPVEWVSGACHLIPRDVWDRAGGLTEETFLGFDDLEYCWRLHRLGYATWYCADADVIHECSAAVGERWSLRRVEELAIHNFYVIAADYLSWPRRKLLNAAEIVGALTELVVAQGKGVDSLTEAGSRRARVVARIRLLCGLFFGRIRPIRRCEPSNDRPPAARSSAA